MHQPEELVLDGWPCLLGRHQPEELVLDGLLRRFSVLSRRELR